MRGEEPPLLAEQAWKPCMEKALCESVGEVGGKAIDGHVTSCLASFCLAPHDWRDFAGDGIALARLTCRFLMIAAAWNGLASRLTAHDADGDAAHNVDGGNRFWPANPGLSD